MVILLASLGVGLQFTALRNSLQKSFLIGFLTLTSILSMVYIIVPKNFDVNALHIFWSLTIVTLFLWTNIFLRKYWQFKFKLVLSQFGLLFFLLALIPFYTSHNIRYHSSPDNHGFGITTAYIKDHYSYNYLIQNFLDATGLDKPIFLGQPTPILESTWHILDMQLRFASDMVLQVGRIGFPALGSVVGSPLQTVEAFTSFVLLLGVISMWGIAVLTTGLVKRLFFLFTSTVSGGSNTTKNSLESKEISLFEYQWIFQLIISLSPWLLIYVIEGAVTQIYFIMGILLQFNLIYDYLVANKSKMVLYLGPIFISVVYPSGFILFIGICGLYTLLINFLVLKKTKWNISKLISNNLHLVFSLLSILPLTIFLTQHTFFVIIKNFLKGAANRPYDLGPVPIFDILPIFGQRLRTLNPQTDVKPFSPVFTDINLGFYTLILLAVVIGVIFTALILKYKKYGFYLSLFLTIPIILMYLPINRLNKANVAWFPYFYFRDLTLLAAIGLPILFSLMAAAFYKKSIKLKPAFILKKIYILASLPIILSTHNLLYNFKDMSREFDIVKRYPFENPDSKLLFVSDKPDHAFLVMAMYGKFNLLTDGWEPELISRIDGTNFDVVYITLNSRNELIPTKIGTFEIESNMKLSGGVITVDQMKSIPGFKQS